MNLFSIENSKDYIDQHPEGFYQIRFVTPLENEILFLNPAAERLVFNRWTEGDRWFSTAAFEDWEAISKIVEQALEIGSWDLTYRIAKPGHTLAWVRDQATVAKDGEDWVAFGSISDITELQEAQLAVTESEERFRLASLCVSDFLYEWNLESGKIIWFGGKKGKIASYSVDFPTDAERWSALIHRSDLAAYEAEAAKSMRNGEIFEMEYRVQAQGGGYRWWSDRGLCMRDEDGVAVRWFGAISDVTKKREQQNQLVKAESAHKRLVESLMDLVWSIDEQDRFIFINGPSRSILGYAPSEMIGKKFADFQPKDIAARDEEMFKRVRRGEEAMHHRTVFLTSEGERRSLSINARLAVDHEDDRLEVHGTARDVTDLHLLEQQFIQAQKMETVGKLAGGIAHDFNNLLTIIHGYASMLTTRGNLDARAQREVGQISQAAEKAESLTRQLLAFSRQQILQSQAVDLDRVLFSLLEMLKRIIGEHIELQTRQEGEAWRIQGDPNMIEQVLVNLLVNARDALPEGGTIQITLEPFESDETYVRHHPEALRGSFICLSIEDNGTGMSPEIASHVFEPFFTTKEQGKGTGLGLPTVYGIVQQHDGWISLETALGEGTIFRLYFPRIEATTELESTPALQSKIPSGGTEAILVVEDEPEVLTVASSLLAARGYQVWEARNATEADVIFGEKMHDIALLLTDIVLPGGRSGRDLANEFRLVRPELAVLFTSGYSMMELQDGGWSLESACFLQKPYSPSTLAFKVREVLDRKPAPLPEKPLHPR